MRTERSLHSCEEPLLQHFFQRTSRPSRSWTLQLQTQPSPTGPRGTFFEQPSRGVLRDVRHCPDDDRCIAGGDCACALHEARIPSRQTQRQSLGGFWLEFGLYTFVKPFVNLTVWRSVHQSSHHVNYRGRNVHL